MYDSRLLALTECHFEDKAASWMMRLEQSNQKQMNIAALQASMIKEFVPPDEKARAKIKLMNCHMKGSVDKHITYFPDLVEIYGTPLSETYIIFFMILPVSHKEVLKKRFTTEDPEDMLTVNEFVRTVDRARQWTSKDSKTVSSASSPT